MKKKEIIETNVNEDTNSTDPNLNIAFEQPINFLALDLGRDDLNILVGKLNEVIKKVNLK